MLIWLDGNNIIMYSIYNEGKSVVAERFLRTMMGKVYIGKMASNNNKP